MGTKKLIMYYQKKIQIIYNFKIIYNKTWILNKLFPIIQNGDKIQIMYNQEFFRNI